MDVVTLARTARENLARGLGALQTPGIPPELVQTAEPIASAMTALHRVESTRGVGTGEAAVGALTAVRSALSQLQMAAVPHPSVDQAMEAIASSLGLVHQLSVLVGQASVSPSPPTQPSSALHAQAEPAPQVAVVGQPAQPGWGQPQQANAAAWQQPAQAAPAPAWQQPAPQAAPAWQQPAAAEPAAAPAWQAPQAPHAPPVAATPHVAPGANVLRVEAALGAHSATNFYKGLSGNDVIDSGGIFIATYNIPEAGQKLVIKVSMPGGYEFEALGEVKWTRDAPNSGADSSPGFGAQFTQISPEARQLVYRYVRNREPLFHDDF
jgi:hypothetical protein